MRLDLQLSARFITGVGVGVAMAAVTLFTVEAARRIRSCRRRMAEPGRIIDGVRPPTRVELAVRPAEEANAPVPPRLESEAPDISQLNERW